MKILVIILFLLFILFVGHCITVCSRFIQGKEMTLYFIASICLDIHIIKYSNLLKYHKPYCNAENHTALNHNLHYSDRHSVYYNTDSHQKKRNSIAFSFFFSSYYLICMAVVVIVMRNSVLLTKEMVSKMRRNVC